MALNLVLLKILFRLSYYGHRYELIGQVDIVNVLGHFIEINYEGFFLRVYSGCDT